jgi:suppressor for copper-sensitivity B
MAGLLLAGALLAVSGSVCAASGPWVGDDKAAVRLISAVDSVGDSRRLPLGLEFRFAPGWHGYWRSPGEAGFGPAAEWGGSQNIAFARLAFPAPQRTSLLGIETFAYKNSVVLPVDAAVTDPRSSAEITVAVEYLACAEICIPYQATLSLLLPGGDGEPAAAEAARLAEFVARVPGPFEAQNWRISRFVAGTATDGPRLDLHVSGSVSEDADLILEAPDGIGGAVPDIRREGGETVLSVRLKGGTAEQIAGVPVTLTLIDGARLAEATLSAVPGEVGAAEGLLLAMLLAAFVGGLILNLMPCVLPVLSLKLMAAAAAAQQGRQAIRAGALATAAGIFASFLLLAGGLTALKAAGATIGWGIQFQQPVFLAAMAGVVVLFAASLFGWIQFLLPPALNAAGSLPPRHPLLDQFVTGGVATLLATPCSAPFVGTAVGFALAGSAGVTFALFAALAAGFAAPYLLLAAAPGAGRFLPRPGRWMLMLRAVLGLGLLGTAVWLLLVLTAVQGLATAQISGGVMIVALGLLALRAKRFPGSRALLLGVLAMLVAAALVPLRLKTIPESAAPAVSLWQRWTPQAAADLVAQGRVVLVDVTAEWCLTCKVNKAAVLDRGAVAALLAEGAITGLRADWTRPDGDIAAFLKRHGRYGIPFNIVYGPGRPQGILLPELLTETAVTEAVAAARR